MPVKEFAHLLHRIKLPENYIMNIMKAIGSYPLTIMFTVAAGFLAACTPRQVNVQPNVIIVLTDDQGYGDLSCHGNPYLKTPQLDKLHDESIRFTDFHVAPMCAPTRGQLLTGVDCVRNACMATCVGRSVVRDEYPMMGEIFATSGYSTGLFGKWHVGYNWPNRPMDRGFQESVYFQGFGLTGMGHYWNCDYYDPYYYHNGELKQAKGYCDDFWFDEAMKWMRESSKKSNPFFCYLATNLPHFPEWIDSTQSISYQLSGAADFYAMISNLDQNMGRLDQFLKDNGLFDNTILIYMTDNGTVHKEVFNAGMTGGKCTRTEGGHRVPCFVRWPDGNLVDPCDIETPAQVQDILLTLIDLCGLKAPANARFDGISLSPLLHGESVPDRMFVVQYYQSYIKKYDAAVVWNQWRLLPLNGDKLYDIKTDLAQKNNIAGEHPEVVEKMKSFYEDWWQEVEPLINDFVPTPVGSPHQQEVKLCSSSWQGVRADGNGSARRPRRTTAKGGPWNLRIEESGNYIIEFCRWPREANAALNEGLPPFIPRFGRPEPEGMALPVENIHIVLGGKDTCLTVDGNEKSVFYTLPLEQGRTKLQAWFSDKNDEPLCGAFYAYVRKE